MTETQFYNQAGSHSLNASSWNIQNLSYKRLVEIETFLQNIKFNSRHLQLNKFPAKLTKFILILFFHNKTFLSSLHMSILMLSKNCLIKIDVWLYLVSTSLHIGPFFVTINCKQDWLELLISPDWSADKQVIIFNRETVNIEKLRGKRSKWLFLSL